MNPRPPGHAHRKIVQFALGWVILGEEKKSGTFGRGGRMSKPTRSPPNRAEERFRALFDAAPDCTLHLTPDGTILDANRSCLLVLGYPRESLVGQALSMLLPDDRLPAAVLRIQKALRTGFVPPFRENFLARNGRQIPFEVNLSATGDSDPIVQVIARDRRVEIAAQHRLYESRELFRALMNSAIDLIMVKDVEGRLTAVNQAFLDLTGRTEDEVIGHTDGELMGQDAARHLAEEDDRVLQDGETVLSESEFDIRGKVYVFQYSKTPVFDAAGKIIGLAAIARDVTGERALARQLLNAQKMDAVGKLAGSIAHDFNDLLTNVIGHLSAAEATVERGENPTASLHSAFEAAKAANELTQRLLRLSKRRPAVLADANLPEIIEEIATAMRSILAPHTSVTTRVDAALWTTQIDRSQIHQTLLNLCHNARDALSRRTFSAPGAPQTPWLEIAAENVTLRHQVSIAEAQHHTAGDYVRIIVSDNGVGMNRESRERIFEPFFTTKSDPTGSGLGLAMVYATVNNHGGWVAVESEPKLGTDFIIYLPRSDVEARPQVTAHRPELGEDLSSYTVLVIDDEPAIRGFLHAVLSREGFHVFTAENGARGLEIVQQCDGNLSLIVLDLVMPEMSGKHFIQLLRERGVAVPLLICSGYPDQMAREELQDLAVDNFIGKPFTPAAFLDKVQEVLIKHADEVRESSPVAERE
jgi:PAS domain S-box-containing protein